MQQRTVTAGGLELSYLENGPPDGPLALCLHGFPDTAHTWRHLLPALGAAGFHAVAPRMRGYAPSAVPADGDGPLSHGRRVRHERRVVSILEGVPRCAARD